MNLLVQIGRKIRIIRKRQKKTQADLADLTGLSDNYIALLERGHRSPSIETLDKISKALKTPINSFFVFTDEIIDKKAQKQLVDKFMKITNNGKFEDVHLAIEIIEMLRKKRRNKEQ